MGVRREEGTVGWEGNREADMLEKRGGGGGGEGKRKGGGGNRHTQPREANHRNFAGSRFSANKACCCYGKSFPFSLVDYLVILNYPSQKGYNFRFIKSFGIGCQRIFKLSPINNWLSLQGSCEQSPMVVFTNNLLLFFGIQLLLSCPFDCPPNCS